MGKKILGKNRKWMILLKYKRKNQIRKKKRLNK